MKNLFNNTNILQTLTLVFPDPIFIIDNMGRYLQFLGGNERLLYSSGNYLVGKRIHDVLPAGKADHFVAAINSAINKNKLVTVEYSLYPSEFIDCPQDGPHGRQWFEARISPLQPEQHLPPSVVVLIINISERKQNEEELKRLSITDPLTGINNRRYFLQTAGYELEQVRRHRIDSSVLLFDIDNFKRINDCFGHSCGDRTIINIVNTISGLLRKCDIIGRIGGDEFAVLLRNTNASQAEVVARKLIAALNNAPLEFDNDRILTTVSIGGTVIRPDDEHLEQVMARADLALYNAKNAGRNCFRFMENAAEDG